MVPVVIYIITQFSVLHFTSKKNWLGGNWQIKNNISAQRCWERKGSHDQIFNKESWESEVWIGWIPNENCDWWAVIATKSLLGGCSLLNRFTSELWSRRGGDIVLSETTGREQNKIIQTILQLICLDTPIVSAPKLDLFSFLKHFCGVFFG